VKDERVATSRTLLERLRDTSDDSAWREFHALYAPLLENFALARGLGADDAEELRDACVELAVRKLPDFEYDPARGSFKGWLHRIALGKVVDAQRRGGVRTAETRELADLADPHPSPEEAWEQVWRREHFRFALREAESRLSERTQQAFSLLLAGHSVELVCERMGMNANQVYKAKARALQSVREVLVKLGFEA